jgi:hypothetical protein
MWKGGVLQRFIFPLKLSLENGNDYSQFQMIFFLQLHKSWSAGQSSFSVDVLLCSLQFLDFKLQFMNEILSMEKVLHYSGAN